MHMSIFTLVAVSHQIKMRLNPFAWPTPFRRILDHHHHFLHQTVRMQLDCVLGMHEVCACV